MKIEQQGPSGNAQSTGRSGGAGNVAGAGYSQFRNPGPGAVEDQGDQASVSQIAQIFQTAQSSRSAQVEKLGGLVRSGGYSVDPAAISRRSGSGNHRRAGGTMIARFLAVEDAVKAVSAAPIPECPALLGSAVEMLTRLSNDCAGISAEENKAIVAGLLRLQASLVCIQKSLERTYAVISAYSDQSGISSQEYSPRGPFHSSGEFSSTVVRS